jgi:hypothetical protein
MPLAYRNGAFYVTEDTLGLHYKDLPVDGVS